MNHMLVQDLEPPGPPLGQVSLGNEGVGFGD